MGLSLELPPTSALHDIFLVKCGIVYAETLQLICVVGMSYQHYLQYCFHCHILFQVARADIDKSVEHEVVSIDEKFDKELDFLLLYVVVVRINILYDACEE